MDKSDLDAIASLLVPAFQPLFLQAFQRHCSLQSLDLSDNKFGPTAANWAAAATGHYFLDDLLLGIGYRAPLTLPQKRVEGHSRRPTAADEDDDYGELSFDGDEGEDDGEERLAGTGESKTWGDKWGDLALDSHAAAHRAATALKRAPGRLAKALFTSDSRKKEML